MGQWTQKCALYMFGLDGVSVSYFHPLNSVEMARAIVIIISSSIIMSKQV